MRRWAVAVAVTVEWATADGTAAAGADYTAVSGNTLTIAPGETGATLRVTLADDALDEADETFTVTLSVPLHATLSDATATGTIRDDEELNGKRGRGRRERGGGHHGAVSTVTVGGGSSTAPVEVSYAVGGTATPGTDYTAVGGTLTLAAGAATGTIAIATLADRVLDPGETLEVDAEWGKHGGAPGAGERVAGDRHDRGRGHGDGLDSCRRQRWRARRSLFTVTLSGAVADAVELGWSHR